MNKRNLLAVARLWRSRAPTSPIQKTLCLLMAATLLGCGGEKKKEEEATEKFKVEGETVTFESNAPQLASISVTTSHPREIAITHVTGRLYWNDETTVRIYTPVAGRVTKVNADIGDTISVGSTLAEIDSPDYGQALADARTAVGNYAAAEKAYNRGRFLLEHGAAAAKDVEAAEAAYLAAQAERDRAEARLANYGGTDKETKALYLLRSPLAGVLVDKNINPGQELRADMMLANAPNLLLSHFTVSDPRVLWLQVDVAEADLPQLEAGLQVRITAKAFPDKVFNGKIDKIGATMDPLTRTVKVRGIVDNPDGLLKAEMYVIVDVVQDITKVAGSGVEASSRALFQIGNDNFLFVEETPRHYVRRKVKVGTEKDNLVPVMVGLKPNEKVVTEGCLLLQALVEPDK